MSDPRSDCKEPTCLGRIGDCPKCGAHDSLSVDLSFCRVVGCGYGLPAPVQATPATDADFDPHDTRGPYVAAHEERAEREIARLRGLIRAVVEYEKNNLLCPLCDPLGIKGITRMASDADQRDHDPGCPWPALVAAAAKP